MDAATPTYHDLHLTGLFRSAFHSTLRLYQPLCLLNGIAYWNDMITFRAILRTRRYYGFTQAARSPSPSRLLSMHTSAKSG